MFFDLQMDYPWTFATLENEARLKLFYCSGEPETTQNYKFRDMNVPITIQVSGRIGLGVFLTEPATAGQLLLVSNAQVSCACAYECVPYAAGLYSEYIHSPKATCTVKSPRIPSKVHQHLVSNLIKLLSTADENLRKKIFNLNTQSSNPFNWISDNVKEVGTNDPTQSELFQRGESDVETVEEQLWNIVFKNAFCDMVRRLDPNKPSWVESFEMWGLWLLPSYINHSCSPNCHRMRVGDAVVIRAATDIAAGEELTLPYFDIFIPLRLREETCDTFGFRCDCRRCIFEQSIGKPYDDMTNTILEVMTGLQEMWSENDTDRDQIDMINWSLQQLHDLQATPFDLILEKAKSDRKNKRTTHAQHASGSNSHPETSDLEKIQLYWISASFIDIHIASLTLALTCRLGDSLLGPRRSRSPQTEESRRLKRIGTVAEIIVQVIREVHPGNVLGQEILLMWVKAFKTRVAAFNFSEDVAAQINDILKELEQVTIPQFFQRFYGFPGDEALKLLVATKS